MGLFDWFKHKKEEIPEIKFKVIRKGIEVKILAKDVRLTLINGEVVNFRIFGSSYCEEFHHYSLYTGERTYEDWYFPDTYKSKPWIEYAHYPNTLPKSTTPNLEMDEVIDAELGKQIPRTSILKAEVSEPYESDKTETVTMRYLEPI